MLRPPRAGNIACRSGVAHSRPMRGFEPRHQGKASMCDYSLESVASRPAQVGDRLITSRFPNCSTRGLTAIGEPSVAVCLLPGTEVVFDREVEVRAIFPFLPN